MIRCLIIKMSSLGDIVHTLPALTDAVNALGEIQFDWVVEESFQEIPSWHPAVNKVIPIALRRWRKNFFKSFFSDEWKQFKSQLKAQPYDIIIDAQGLLKSAIITHMVNGNSYGLDKNSARESLASRFYQYPQTISKDQHAVERTRQLFAQALNYQLPITLDYGINNSFIDASHKLSSSYLSQSQLKQKPQILFFHGTTWKTKHWPEQYWLELANELISDNYMVLLPWGNMEEKQRADKIKKQAIKTESIHVLAKMTLKQIAQTISQVEAVIAVDTGLAHLAAALDKPQISLFGPTNPVLTRPYSSNASKQIYLQVDFACKACLKKHCPKLDKMENPKAVKPPCYSSLMPEKVFQSLQNLLSEN